MKKSFLLAVWIVSILWLREAVAGSVSFETVSLERALRVSERIVVGAILETGTFQSLSYTRIRVIRVLKGAAAKPNEELRLFSEGEWFGHTHAAAIQGGVVSYSLPRYATTAKGNAVQKGRALIFFLGGASFPSDFPPGSVLMPFGESFDRVEREEQIVTQLKNGQTGDFNFIMTLKMREKVRFPDHLEMSVYSHSHKRPVTGGPQKEYASVEVSQNGETEMIQLDHVTSADGSEHWGKVEWKGYSFELRGMNYDSETSVVARKK
jgi:hypothetical protein